MLTAFRGINMGKSHNNTKTLNAAITHGNGNRAKELIAQMDENELTKTDDSGRSPIDTAAGMGQSVLVTAITNKSPNAIVSGNNLGETSLHQAAKEGAKIAQDIIFQGGDPLAVDKSGKNPLADANDQSTAGLISSKTPQPGYWVNLVEDEKKKGRGGGGKGQI